MNTDKMKTSIGLVEESWLRDFQRNAKMETDIGFGRKPGPFDILFTFEKTLNNQYLKNCYVPLFNKIYFLNNI